MNPGKLDRRITFGDFISVENEFQDYVITFVPELVTWANVKPSDGSRQLEAGEQVINQTYRFTIRYRRDFQPTKDMRIEYGGDYFTIHSVRDLDDRRRFIEIIGRVTDENSKD
jgi:SPP1 family predicted phage head-tail adaptor